MVVMDQEDEEDETPKYMRDRQILNFELEDILESPPFETYQLFTGISLTYEIS